ncbi:hypothetical protein [Streptomyces chartreusis]|uniref:hypothetical protein n=1 Tax=Streptomyces chartreusis TaxID=1969 RepID=UPI00363ABEBD
MQFNDKPINGQPHSNSPSFLDLIDQTPPPPQPDAQNVPGTARFARLREAWNASWEKNGFLYQRWEELLQARRLGWHEMAHWIKAAIGLAGVCAFIVLLDAAGDIVTAAAHRIATATPDTQLASQTSNSFWAVIDTPVRAYLAQHTSGLAVSGSTAYAFWQAVGLVGLIGGFFHSSGARITWTVWGAATVAAVWSASPAAGRTVATAIAVLAWTIASAFALRGLSLRPVIHTAFQPHIDIRPKVHIPQQPTPHRGLDDEPDNVHPLQR